MLKHLICILVVCLVSLDAEAVNRHDFRLLDVKSWLSRRGSAPLTSSAKKSSYEYGLYTLPVDDPEHDGNPDPLGSQVDRRERGLPRCVDGESSDGRYGVRPSYDS